MLAKVNRSEDTNKQHPFHPGFAILVALFLALFLLLSAGEGSAQRANAMVDHELSLELFAQGFADPTNIAFDPLEGKAFVVERQGVILRSADGQWVPFLDISDRVESSYAENGLLGLAFHLDYADNRLLYVYYIDLDGDTQISRFTVNEQNTAADPDSERMILSVAQPSDIHAGGDLLFGPDGYLYIPLGDGGPQNDPLNNAQNPQTLLGKLLRIDVDGGEPYSIPPDNPFVQDPDTLDEIWAFGLRNPWRASFDRQTGELYIADVGYRRWEEVSVQPAGMGGQNYGWSCFEGTHANGTTIVPDCQPAEYYDMPVAEYGHADLHCAVIGGYVYRGSRYANMFGRYYLLDFCSGNFWDLARDGGVDWVLTRHSYLTDDGFVAFGEDGNGELYVVNTYSGAVYHLVGIKPHRQSLPLMIKAES